MQPQPAPPEMAPDDRPLHADPVTGILDGAPGGHGRGAGKLPALMLAALGIVYGDIGTSPIYALKECFGHTVGVPLTPANVLGFLSLIAWALILVVTVKYVVFVMRADNRGEGGILALTALALRGTEGTGPSRRLLMGLGVFGAALFFGDGMITPAISVLSAVEGLEVMAPNMERFVEPAAIVILVGLFMMQRGGTATVGRLFGPVMVVWFLTLGLMGAWQVVQEPSVLRALSPTYALAFLAENRWLAFLGLGTVVLAITGAEALYADMGHLGRPAIRYAWIGFVLPALLLNYFGQGALLIRDPAALEHPFFRLVPEWGLLPLLILTTAATIIASQAMISGAFSMAREAIQIGLMPRQAIRHTSESEIGQIYVPRVNWFLLMAVILLVLGFQSSSNLAAAYGIAVMGTMTCTSVLFGVAARRQWNWPLPAAAAATVLMLCVDLPFLGANLLKVPEGGWFPLLAGSVMFYLMWVWRQGRTVVMKRLEDAGMDVDDFLASISRRGPQRVPGTAVFLTSNIGRVPHALLHNLKHNMVLHERVVLLTVLTRDVPWVRPERRAEVTPLGHGFHRVVLRYGFKESPRVPEGLEQCRRFGLNVDPMRTSYFLGRETLVPSVHPDMSPVNERVFILLSANALSASDFFCIPPNRVVELGTQLEI
ncbi:potassium transporter Kup [Azospirillum sp.]|uniref:potassium transporter Kup n=1 Tax=Azospirillum sp. TaxID=34012 RepID=UPI003D72FA6C